MAEPFPLITVAGAPRERGRSYGRQAEALILRAIAIYEEGFAARGLSWDAVVRRGDAFAQRIREHSAPMHEELLGIAEGAGRKLGEIVALNARTELLYGLRGEDKPHDIDGDGCTGAIALGGTTASGHVLHGQNWDWRSQAAEVTMVLRVQPDEGPGFVTLVEAGTLARCGVSEAGIAITGNFLKTDNDFGEGGIPAPFVRRAVLSSESFHDAMGEVLTTPRSFSINVMISTAGGAAVNFETTPAEAFWLLPEDDILVHANHFRSPGALTRVRDRGLEVTPDSLYREARVRSALDDSRGAIDRATLRNAFLDHWGAPHAVCRSPSHGPGGEEAATVATVIMDLNDVTLDVAPLPYREPRFWRYDLANDAPVEVTL